MPGDVVRERVIEISAFVAAPLAGMTLAGLGCEVLRVDPPGGGLDFERWPVTRDGVSIFWAGLNRGKHSVVVDFRREEGCELVASLVTAGGVEGGFFLTSLAPRGPLRHESLLERRADVVSVEIQGYPDGSSAVDYTVAASSGVPELTGPEGHIGPVNSPLPTWDIATGLNAAMAAREAMDRRRRTGDGTRVRIALADVALGLLCSLGFIDEIKLASEPRERDGNYLYGAFGRDFLLADGSRVMIVAITLKQWRALVAALDIETEVADLQRSRELNLDRMGDRFHARREIAELVERWCSMRPAEDVVDILDRRAVCWSFYSSAEDFLASVHPEISASASSATAGLVRDVGLPFRFGNEIPTSLGIAPVLGQDTERVLAELLGLSQREIGRLHDDGLVAIPVRSLGSAGA